ncbi:tyrosine-protein phosphatase non-receptor type 21-like isoform X2 [Bolinopsis microptera]|uniref:tyrosine-protein phosphatase non-receptor type 21-like isoform X2 n=1 Tax=Bolinopsis microptera TaxID=2820187 RepID=UPI00307A6203
MMPQRSVRGPADRGPSSRVTVTTYRNKCEIMVTGDTKGLEIISDVCDIFKLPEPAYFGVRLKRDGSNFWMENEETIRQVCGKKWIEVVKVLDFKIRFFPPDLTRISDDNIIYSYFTHIRDDVIKGNLMTDPTTAVSLSALILQADGGNYDPMVHDADFIRQADCIPSRYSKNNSTMIDNIVMEYEKLSGMRSVESQVEFLDRSQGLHDCGVDYYPTKDKSGSTFNIGAGHNGVFIKHNKLDNLILFKWVNIVTMKHDGKFLWLEIENKKPSTFEMLSKEIARMVFTSFIAQHNFKLGRRLSPFKTYGEKRSIRSKSSREEVDSRASSISATPPSKRTLLTANGSPSKTDLRNHLLKMLTQPEEIRMEYLGIDKTKPDGTHIVANLPENKPTNRFRDIIPYDDTRVHLHSKRGDYINASHVNIDNSKHKYILSQGPKDNTVSDFWKMVWDQGISVIAMVTQLREGYKAKCSQYWPDEVGEELETEELKVTMKFVRDDVLYVTRSFLVMDKETEQSLDVIHLQFTSWPDHGVPKTPKDLLDYLSEVQSLTKEMKKPNMGEDCPILIHCSAGVGRSGVLLMMDILTRAVDNNEHVDIPGTLRKLRTKRSHIVQTEEQYLFIYTALIAHLDQSRLI